MTLTCEEVENWLEANPQWTREYFHQKTTVDLVLKWIRSNKIVCEEYGIYTRLKTVEDVLNNNSNAQNIVYERNYELGEDLQGPDEAIFHYSSCMPRRFSEPGITRAPRQILRKNHSFLGLTNTTIHENEPDDEGRRFNASLFPTNSRCQQKEMANSPIQQRLRSIPQLGSLIESRIKLPSSKTLDQGKKLNLKRSNEADFFYEIIKDIANNLNLRTLSYNILVNIGILTNADRCSLFLVEGPKGRRSLVSELFDVHPICLQSTSETSGMEIRVPWGKGIVGYAADTGKTVNIEDAYAVSRTQSNFSSLFNYKLFGIPFAICIV